MGGDDVRQDAALEEPRVDEHDREPEAEDRAQDEPGERLLRGEPGRVEQGMDEGGAARGDRLPERVEDVVDVRHRRVVHQERPRPARRLPQPLVALPGAPERRDDEHVRRQPSEGGHDPRRARLDCDGRHLGAFLTTPAGAEGR